MRLKNVILTLFAVTVGTALLAAQTRTAPVLPAIVAEHPIYRKLPLTFEANRGQTNGRVNFLSRVNGYTAFLTSGGMVLSLRPSERPSGNSAASSQPAASTLQFNLLGANKNPQAIGEDQQPGIVNYFIGNNPAKWQTRVPTYAKARYKNVYPGIDLIYYGNHQQLEYDFAVAPGADPRLIQFEIQGANEVRLDSDGSLLLTTNGGELRFQSPIVYQESNGLRVPVQGGYAVKDAKHIGFELSDYDSSKPVVIDPVLLYSTYLGGSGSDQVTGIAADATGKVYVAGYTNSANFPSAISNGLPANANHVFVTKLDPTGSTLIYTDYFGGNGNDYGSALVLDSKGDVYVTGSTASSDFPVVKAFQAQQPGPYSGFVSEVSPDGSSLMYSTYLGGNTFDLPTGIAIDGKGELYVAGSTMSQDFPVFNAYQATVSANQDGLFGTYGFLTKFSSNGSSLVFSTFVAGNSNVIQDCGTPCWPSPYSAISGIALDTNGSAYLTGTTNTYNFPTTAGTFQTSNTTQQDATVGFITKFNSTGGLDYSSYFYSSSGYPVAPNALAVDNSGSVYITGVAFSDGTFPITSTGICDPGVYGFGCSYAFVTKFDPAASSLLYSTFLGPNNYASPMAIALDADNDAYVAATTRSAAIDTVNGIESYSNGADILLAEIDPLGTTQLFATYVGGSQDDTAVGLAVDPSGNVYIAGSTSSVDFPTTQGAFQTSTGGNLDGFIAKISPASAPSVSVSPAAMQFGILAIGSTSQPQTVSLRNMGSSPLSIFSITTSGDFAETDNCGNSIPAAGQCAFTVTFTPTASGSRSGSVTIVDDAAGSPHSITLSGTGAGANVLLTPSTLNFPTVLVGTSSATQPVTLTNNGTATLSINSIQTTGDFSQSNNCPVVLAYGASCTINVQFNPSTTGTRAGTVTVSDNAQGSPQTVSLSGTGSNVSAVLTPASLTFSSVAVGTSSLAQVVTLTNMNTTTLSISNVQVTGDYSQTNNCSTGLAGNASCSISIQFTPTASGTRTGVLTVNDNGQGGSQAINLSGTGTDFSMAATPGQQAIKSGSSATYSLTVSAVGGSFSNAVNLSCSGLPAKATCKFSPSAVTPGNSAAASTLTISTVASSAEAVSARRTSNSPVLAIWIQLQGLGLFGMVLVGSKKRSKSMAVYILCALMVLGMLFMSGCAGGTGIASQSGSGQSGTSYTVTITGLSGSLQHSVPLTLTVQ